MVASGSPSSSSFRAAQAKLGACTEAMDRSAGGFQDSIHAAASRWWCEGAVSKAAPAAPRLQPLRLEGWERASLLPPS
eukprot:15461499-Alexandrium_andersonii.AAC.1